MINFAKESVRYIIAGVFNTLLGYGSFLFLINTTALSAFLANALTYLVTLIIAFILNKYYVFRVSGKTNKRVMLFLLGFIIAFCLNQLALLIMYKGLRLPAELAQLFAMATYTIVFFLLNKYMAFKKT